MLYPNLHLCCLLMPFTQNSLLLPRYLLSGGETCDPVYSFTVTLPGPTAFSAHTYQWMPRESSWFIISMHCHATHPDYIRHYLWQFNFLLENCLCLMGIVPARGQSQVAPFEADAGCMFSWPLHLPYTPGGPNGKEGGSYGYRRSVSVVPQQQLCADQGYQSGTVPFCVVLFFPSLLVGP